MDLAELRKRADDDEAEWDEMIKQVAKVDVKVEAKDDDDKTEVEESLLNALSLLEDCAKLIETIVNPRLIKIGPALRTKMVDLGTEVNGFLNGFEDVAEIVSVVDGVVVGETDDPEVDLVRLMDTMTEEQWRQAIDEGV